MGEMLFFSLVVRARSMRYLFPDGRGTKEVCLGCVLSVLIDLAFLFRWSSHRVQVWELSSYDLFCRRNNPGQVPSALRCAACIYHTAALAEDALKCGPMSRCVDKPAYLSFCRKRSLFWALFTRLEMIVAHVHPLHLVRGVCVVLLDLLKSTMILLVSALL